MKQIIGINSQESFLGLSKKQLIGIILLTCIIFIYAAFFAFYSNREPEGPIEVYFADRMTKAHLMLIDKYNALHKDSVKIVPINFPSSEFSTDMRKEVLARSLRGDDDAIDIFAVDIIGVHRFAKWSEPLDPYFTETEKKRILPAALRNCYSDGKLVAIPFDLVQGVMYYREDLLKKSQQGRELIPKIERGITWEEFCSSGKSINGNRPFYIFPASDYEGLICSYIENLLSLKPDYFETIGFKFTTREGRKALRQLVDLVQSLKLTPPIVTTFTEINSYEYFIKNDGLFIRGWTIYDKDFSDQPVDRTKEQYLKKAMIPYPAEGRPASLFGGWDLMIVKSSKKKRAAINFMKFLLTDESQEIIYKQGGYYPVIRTFFEDTVYSQRYPESKILREFITHGVFRPNQQNYTRYSKIMARYFSLAIAGKISVDEAIWKTQQAIDAEERQRISQ